LNNQVTFTDGSANATTWFWDFGDGNTSNVQNPGSNTYANTGTYVVTQIVTNGGCSDTVVYQVIITTLSANGLMSEDALEIYPNPSQGVFNIRLGDEGGRTVQLSILDVNGKEVFFKNLQDNATHAIDITSLAKGNYVLRLTHEKGRSERKIVRN
jgi:PKD repeat protein